MRSSPAVSSPHGRRIVLVLIVALAGELAGAVGGKAEVAARPPEPRFELSLLAGSVRSPVVVEESALHTRPWWEETGKEYEAPSLELAARVAWSPRISTSLAFGGTAEVERSEEFDRHEPSFPSTMYEWRRTTSRRIWYLSVVQALSFRAGSRLQPYLAAGLETRKSEDLQVGQFRGYLDPAQTATGSSEWSKTRTVAIAGAGIRWLVSPRLVVTSDLSSRLLSFSGDLAGEYSLRWRAGLGVRF